MYSAWLWDNAPHVGFSKGAMKYVCVCVHRCVYLFGCLCMFDAFRRFCNWSCTVLNSKLQITTLQLRIKADVRKQKHIYFHLSLKWWFFILFVSKYFLTHTGFTIFWMFWIGQILTFQKTTKCQMMSSSGRVLSFGHNNPSDVTVTSSACCLYPTREV